MKSILNYRLTLSIICLLACTNIPTWAQGRIIIEPPRPMPWPRPRPRPIPIRDVPLHLKYLNIDTEITDGVAVTNIKQSFHNISGRQIEGMYVFPMPDNAVVGSFQMTLNGREMHGEVLDADQARKIYEQIVARMRDPGLLEFLGARLYRVKVFPIPPGGRLDVELQYSQTLRENAGLGLFQHPLRGVCEQGHNIEQLIIQAKIRSQLPLTSVFCPSHKCEITRASDRAATVTFEQANYRPDADFQLYYQRTDAMFGISLLTHASPAEAGYFLLRVAPNVRQVIERIQSKDVAFVIDTSGSMRGAKIDQAREALKFCVSSLNDGDRFNIHAFSTEVRPFREELVRYTSDLRDAAVEYADKLQALGGTNINQALLAALADDPREDERPYLIVFVTDGEPTIDVTDPELILKNVKEHNSRRVRFHVLGVGTQVNTHLLDKLAEMNRGSREYCIENENLELKLSALIGRLSHPVLTDLVLRIPGAKTFDIYPRTLPDLFRGGDLVVLGRYEGTGHHSVELEGRLLDSTHVYTYEGEFPARSAAHDFLPRLWANRKIAFLLDQIRLHGRKQELVDEVVRLAKRHGIVTPYTSALILEDEDRLAFGGQRPRMRRAGEALIAGIREAHGAPGAGGRGAQAKDMPASTGAAAVDASRVLREACESEVAPASQLLDKEEQALVRYVNEKTFIFDGERWIDTAWDGQQAPQQITAFGSEYFELIKQQPRLARFFALGERVVVVLDRQVYESLPAEDPGDEP
ncbi:MAG: VIT domain-containing protein [Planctomycetota bacterium]